MLSPKEILSLLKKNELPDYAKKKKSFFGKLFSKADWYKTMELGNRAINENRSSYTADQIIKNLTQLVHDPKSIFDIPEVEYLEFNETYRYILHNKNHILRATQKYIETQRWQGLDYKYLRYLIFLGTFQKQGYSTPIRTHIVTKFPQEYKHEVALVYLLGYLKSNNIKRAIGEFYVLEKMIPHESNYFDKYFQEWFQIILAEGNIGCSDATLIAIDFFQKIKNEIKTKTYELSEKNKNLPYNEHEVLNVENLNFYPQTNTLDQAVIIELVKLIMMHGNHHDLYTFLTNLTYGNYLATLIKSIKWTEQQLFDFIIFCIKPYNISILPKAVLKSAKVLLEKNHTKILDALWAYYPKTKHANKEDKAALKLLQNFAHLRERHTSTEATIHEIIASGFEPVRPGYTQNIYKGMNPEQVRPFFRLLREVGDVDIIKFYQDREKNKHVRFQINGEQYDLPTTNGLGLTIVQPLNTLLFENNISYQFVVIQTNRHKVKLNLAHINTSGLRITLVNEVCYNKHPEDLHQAVVAGFAKTDQSPPAFLKRIEELKPITLKTNLDKIDLKSDPKFTVIRAELDKLKDLPNWTNLLIHCLRYPLDAKPSKTWQKQAKEIVEKLGTDNFQSGQVMLLEKLTIGEEWFQDTEKLCALRGLTWLSRLHPSKGQYYILQKVANKSYKKVPGGPLNAKLGNIALETLANIGNLEAFGVINNVEAKAKYSVYKRAIASRKKKFTKLLKEYSAAELADRSVPTHELINGKSTTTIGDVKALLQMDGFKVNITYELPNGKIQKSVPAHLKADYAAEIKAIKAEGKSIVESLSSQSKRLEKSWLIQRKWSLENWKEFLMNHGLMQVVAARLIWRMETEQQSLSFMIRDGQPIDPMGNPMDFLEGAKILLWHPSLVSVEETLAWRNYIFQKQIKQPFKQAFREVYLLTPAEEATYEYSNRFGGHHLKGNTLYSLGKNREWKMSYEEAPYFVTPDKEWMAVLNIRGGVLYSECDTQELYFKKIDPTAKISYHYNIPKEPLQSVPPIILSEVMRDVDLFVAVAGMGVDPYFDQNQTGDLMNYWRDASFGKRSQTALAEVRRDLLERLLPMTKIKDKCSFEGNFLKVEGKIRTYKINLGSSNILMEPNDQYLCIVPGQNKSLEKKIWLPFEGGDKVLMIILSKAFLLAEDDKIKDGSIVAQINRK